MTLTEKLAAGVAALELTVEAAQIDRLVQYVELLDKWNSHFNLTAIRDIQQMVALHLLDSLATLPFIDGARILDVGTGPGLPGIPLAICLPNQSFTLLDSNVKKTRFLTQAKIELELPNVDVVKQRIEQYNPPIEFDVVISRAFASISDMVNSVQHLVCADTRILAMKGDASDEIRALPDNFEIVKIHELQVPGLDARRQLVELKSIEIQQV